MKLELNDTEKDAMKRFYEEELDKTIHRLSHLRAMLARLDSSTQIDITISGVGYSPIGKPSFSSSSADKSGRKRKKKRGRKSIWGDYILNELRSVDRPMKYSEIIQSAKIRFNIPSTKMKQLKAAINQSAFRLRTIHKKIDTVGEEGKKEKYIVLKSWLDNKGKLGKAHAKHIV